jgi:hypothetical protein
MKAIALVLVLVLGLPPAAAAQGPLTQQARAELARALEAPPREVVIESRMQAPVVFWIGVALLAAGVIGVVASVSWERESDLSHEYSNVRLGRDLAPCGTDPAATTRPIADCKVNDELAWVGSGLALAGGGLMLYGGRQIQQIDPDPYPGIRYTLKF